MSRLITILDFPFADNGIAVTVPQGNPSVVLPPESASTEVGWGLNIADITEAFEENHGQAAPYIEESQ